ncbi:hypothetical protein [Advenella mimigardefordensis]|uniref:Uncharacterized protein n=1 Tax=Advenella mimigardefordensis (strain DSM 17166 / LMG 22922 / DPN7) TaxID=1247726 RepID=W0P8G8_ADVMD|nr:hypothetical protein [Advenella mimigardefordensis]AHG63154.1 hypothetical protein MIM_c10560 [Advenella mimigardefordensis DPN7]
MTYFQGPNVVAPRELRRNKYTKLPHLAYLDGHRYNPLTGDWKSIIEPPMPRAAKLFILAFAIGCIALLLNSPGI